MNVVKIGLLGLGTVGKGIWQVLNTNREEIRERSGYDIEISKILVRDINKDRGIKIPKELLTCDFKDILNDDDIDIVVEVIGGIEPAKDFMINSMRRKKHVVTANKMVIARYGDELFRTSKEENVGFYYEASVCGGIPIIRSINEGLTATKIENMVGILNGTTNYILSKMFYEGIGYSDALLGAQMLGYAEADPASDVEGYDAVYKLAIMSSLAFNTRVYPEFIYREGITAIDSVDMEYASKIGYVIKLLAIAKSHGETLELRVHPAMVPNNHPIAAVNDVFNGVFINSNSVGELMFYGKGAGDLPTGSSVVGDIISILRNSKNSHSPLKINFGNRARNVMSIDDIETSYYLRLNTKNIPNVTSEIIAVLNNSDIMVDNVLFDKKDKRSAVTVLTTNKCRESNVKKALLKILQLENVINIGNMIRIEKFEAEN